MTERIRVGLIGASASGQSWSSVAHIPAIHAVPELELSAVCTRRLESAKAAAEVIGIERYYDDVNKLVADKDIDLVAVVVKVPGHFEAVCAALNAGKHIYCEWPLGLDLDQTREMAKIARSNRLISAVGLQGRHDPHLSYIKALNESDWFGKVLSVEMSMVMRGSSKDQTSAKVPGASMFAVAGGHTLDTLTNCFGELSSLQAQVGQAGHLVPREVMMSTGMLDEEADYVSISAQFANGAFLTAQVMEVQDHNSGWQLTVRGSEGTIVASTSILPQISPITIQGARNGQKFSEMIPPTLEEQVLRGAPIGPPRNIAIAYNRLSNSIRNGIRFRADFDDAVQTHELLTLIQNSSETGQRFDKSREDSTTG